MTISSICRLTSLAGSISRPEMQSVLSQVPPESEKVVNDG